VGVLAVRVSGDNDYGAMDAQEYGEEKLLGQLEDMKDANYAEEVKQKKRDSGKDAPIDTGEDDSFNFSIVDDAEFETRADAITAQCFAMHVQSAVEDYDHSKHSTVWLGQPRQIKRIRAPVAPPTKPTA